MRLRTKLVLTASGLTFAIVLVLSTVFLSQLLRQRTEQTFSAKDVRLATIEAVETGLRAHPPPDAAEDPLHAAVMDALRSDQDLQSAMDRVVRYSEPVQDVSVTDAHGFTMLSTDPDAINQRAVYRDSFARLRDGSVYQQVREVFGAPVPPARRQRVPTGARGLWRSRGAGHRGTAGP